jgi:hypothetical protein
MTRATDPYRQCELACRHDLGRGVRLADLLEGDGPYPLGPFLMTPTRRHFEPATAATLLEWSVREAV